METFEFRKGLYQLATHFSHSDVKKLKFMCDDDLPRGALERAGTAFDIFILMENKELISPLDLEYLEEMMEVVGKKHLVRQYIPPLGIQVVHEDHPEYSKSVDEKENRKFKVFLSDLANNFSKSNIRDVSFFFYHPDVLSFQQAESMASGDELLSELKTKGVLGVNNMQRLRSVLFVIGRKDLCNTIDEYNRRAGHGGGGVAQDPLGSCTVQPQQEMGHPMAAFSLRSGSGGSGPNDTASSFASCPSSNPTSLSSEATGSSSSSSAGNYTASTDISSPSSDSTTALESSPSSRNSSMVFSKPRSIHTDHPHRDDSARVAVMETAREEEPVYMPMETEGENTKLVMALKLNEQETMILQQQRQLDEFKQELKMASIEQDRERHDQEVRRLQESLQTKNREVEQLRSEKQQLHQNFLRADGSYYTMNSRPHGLAIIIVNRDFRVNPLDSGLTLRFRSGADLDRKLFAETFNFLEYKVEVYENLTGMDMFALMDRVARMNHSQYDSFVCCVSTHGDEQVMYGSDSVAAKRIEFIDRIRLCKSLARKPKMFFIQACRTQTHSSPPLPQHSMSTIEPNAYEADVFVANATMLGHPAYNSQYGSWFVNAVRNVFVSKAHTLSLAHLMYAVNHQVGDAKGRLKSDDDGSTTIVQQCAEWTTSLRMEVRFFEHTPPLVV